MRRVGDWIAEILEAPGDEDRITRVREEVRELCAAFPLYEELAS